MPASKRIPRLLFTLTLLLLSIGAHGACLPITHIPAVINKPGPYCLEADHELSMNGGIAIDIQSANVRVDFAGHTLTNRYGVNNTAVAVQGYSQSNVEVSGGAIIGFREGIILESHGNGCVSGSGPYRVRDMTVSRAYSRGISLEGCQLQVQSNSVLDTGINTRINATGISVIGTPATVTNNEVLRLIGYPGNSVGIQVFDGSAVIERNRVLSVPVGISMSNNGRVLFRDNTVVEAATEYDFGEDGGGNR